MSDEPSIPRTETRVGGPWSRKIQPTAVRAPERVETCRDDAMHRQWEELLDLRVRNMELEDALSQLTVTYGVCDYLGVRDTREDVPPPLDTFPDTDVVDEFDFEEETWTRREQTAAMAELIRSTRNQ